MIHQITVVKSGLQFCTSYTMNTPGKCVEGGYPIKLQDEADSTSSSSDDMFRAARRLYPLGSGTAAGLCALQLHVHRR